MYNFFDPRAAGLLIKAPSRTFLQVDPLLLRTDMSKPDDDTDVPSGFDDDARMERTPSRSSEMVIIGTTLTRDGDGGRCRRPRG